MSSIIDMRKIAKKIKRLIKKASQPINLYHFTSSQIFMKIMEEGQITSGGYNGNVSNGGHVRIFDFATNETQGNKTMKLDTLSTTKDYAKNGDNTQFTKELAEYIEQRKEENEDSWRDETIEVSVTNPSYNEIGVYLTKDIKDENDYAAYSLSVGDASIPNFQIALKVDVQTNALSPDYDDLSMMNIELNSQAASPLWKQSLDRIRQVVHNGPIDVSSIIGVQIIGGVHDMNAGDKFTSDYKFLNWYSQYVTRQQWMSADEMYNSLRLMLDEYQKLEVDDESMLELAKSKSRLKKRG